MTITWFVGLGTGTNDAQIAAQNKVVDDFNATHPNINLVLNIAAANEIATDTLSTLLAAGTPPDIVGPVGVGGSNSFADQWMDVKPLADAAGFDMSTYDPALVELYRRDDGGLSGIPFAVYPVITYYNQDLFDEAGLNYPPTDFGAMYTMPDGSEVAWNYDTIAEIGKILTVDGNGNDATSADFDPSNIVQFGMNFQWARIRLILDDLQPASYYDAATGTVKIPDVWRQATQWYWDAIWNWHIYPECNSNGFRTTAAERIRLRQPRALQSRRCGTPAASTTASATSSGTSPRFRRRFDGEQHVAIDADTFRIVKASAHPAEAFEVLAYLETDAAPALATAYGAYPALPAAQQAWVDSISQKYPWDINWGVASASLAYANPGKWHHESNVPNYAQTDQP